MPIRAVPLLAAGIGALLLASAVGAVVVSGEDDELTTGTSTTVSFPPFEDSTTSSVVEAPPTVVIEVPAAPVAPVPAPGAATTTTAPPPAPVLAVDPAPCQPPAAQPAAGGPVGSAGVFTAAVSNGAVRLVGPTARFPAWRPRTGQIVSVAVAQGKPAALCLSGADGADTKRLTTPAGVGRPAVSFDGGRLAARSVRPGGVDLVVGSVEGADLRLILQSNEIGDPVWLGDGSAVVTCAVTSGARRLVAVPAAGGTPVVLRDACPASPVASSPDGRRITFAQGDQVVVLEVRSRATTNLRMGPIATGSAPSWSPDGRKVAFAYNEPDGPALGILDLDAKNGATRLRAPGLSGPSWAPAGDLIAFSATEGSSQALSVVKPDGSGRRLVAPCRARCSLAAQPWASDGSSVVLDATGAG